MEWILPIGCVLIYFVYTFSKERKEMVDIQVTSRGGMKKKYTSFIEGMQQKAKFIIVRETRDELELNVSARGTTINIHLVEMLNEVEVNFVAQLYQKGTHRKNWTFPDGYDQGLMVTEVDNYFNWLGSQMG